MAEQIKFTGEQGGLTIEVCGYERPAAEDQDDANWLNSTVTVKAGPFAGAFKSSFTTYDLIRLHDELKTGLAALSGIVNFHNTENDIEFNIEFNNRGSASFTGIAHPHRWLEASLEFRLDTDQSALRQTLRQLEDAIRRFPVKQAQ